jgi:hypothetical protein
MLLSPIRDLNESPLAQQWAAFEQFTKQMTDNFRSAAKAGVTVDVAAAEAQLFQNIMEVGRLAMQQILQALELGTDKVLIDGQEMVRVVFNPKSYQSRFGPVKVHRGLYRPSGRNTATVCPLELEAGIIEGFWTPGAARLAAQLGAQLPLRAAQQIADEAGMRMTTSGLGRLLPNLSARWEESRESNEAQLREMIEVPEPAVSVCLSVDGVLAPMCDKAAKRQEQKAQPGKHGSGPGGYREVGCGTVTFYDAQGERLETQYRARMPEAKKASLAQSLNLDMMHLVA